MVRSTKEKDIVGEKYGDLFNIFDNVFIYLF